MLKQLQCWEHIAPHAQPIHSMIITDAYTNDPVKPTLLTFEGDVTPNEPFAAMVEHKELLNSLKSVQKIWISPSSLTCVLLISTKKTNTPLSL